MYNNNPIVHIAVYCTFKWPYLNDYSHNLQYLRYHIHETHSLPIRTRPNPSSPHPYKFPLRFVTNKLPVWLNRSYAYMFVALKGLNETRIQNIYNYCSLVSCHKCLLAYIRESNTKLRPHAGTTVTFAKRVKLSSNAICCSNINIGRTGH